MKKFPIPIVEVEGVDVVEVLAVAEVVVEAAEDDEVALQQDHPVTGARRGATGGAGRGKADELLDESVQGDKSTVLGDTDYVDIKMRVASSI